MKNVKKSLALLLAFVMILGMSTMGASAAFNDADKINTAYQEAVDVMSGMGILAGSDSDGDGKFDFNPTGNVTRAQAAKMISYMILGKDSAERLPAKPMFKDVPVSHWAAKYVYYLANKKVINGFGDGNFGPDDSVTANQMAKMLLVAAGWGQLDEFVGAGWDINVFTIAVEEGLFKGTLAMDYDAAATREEASLYVFNTMTEVPLMVYSKDDGYKLKDGVEKTFGSTKYNYDDVEGVIVATKADGSKYTLLDTYENKINKTLTLNFDVASSLVGHKVSVAYSTKKETDVSGIEYYNAYTVTDKSKEVAMARVSYKTLYNNIGGSRAYILENDTTVNTAGSFTCWVNNIDETTSKYSAFKASYDKIAEYANVMPPVPNGATGYLILDQANTIIGHKDTSYTVREVKSIVTTAGSELITLSGTPVLELKNSAKEDEVVEYDGIAKGDFVSVSKTGDKYTLVKCTMLDDLKVNTLGKDGFTTLNGTYWKNGDTAVNKLTGGDDLAVGNTYDVYLDKENKYVYAKKVEAVAQDVAFVSYIYFRGGDVSTGTKEYYAKCVGADGTIKDYLITKNTYETLDDDKTVTLTDGATPTPNTTGYVIDKLYALSMTTATEYGDRAVADLKPTGIEKNASQTFDSNYRVLSTTAAGSLGNYILADDVEYIFVNTPSDSSDTNTYLKTQVSISKSKPASNVTKEIYFNASVISKADKTYSVSKVFILSGALTTDGTSYIYSSNKDAYTYRTSYIGHSAPKATGTGTDDYLYAFIDQDYHKDLKFKDTPANKALFDGEKNLKGGFYRYTVDANGYYELFTYDGTGDNNAVVDFKPVTSIYNNMISAGGITDVHAENAAIVDFSGYGLTTLDDISSYLREGKTIKVSFWSYLYDTNKGTDKATTTTIYINDIS